LFSRIFAASESRVSNGILGTMLLLLLYSSSVSTQFKLSDSPDITAECQSYFEESAANGHNTFDSCMSASMMASRSAVTDAGIVDADGPSIAAECALLNGCSTSDSAAAAAIYTSSDLLSDGDTSTDQVTSAAWQTALDVGGTQDDAVS
jgi:hypothetical protein